MASGPEVPPAQAAGTEERAGTRSHLVWVTGCQLRALAMGAALSRGEQRTGPGGHGVSFCHAASGACVPTSEGLATQKATQQSPNTFRDARAVPATSAARILQMPLSPPTRSLVQSSGFSRASPNPRITAPALRAVVT